MLEIKIKYTFIYIVVFVVALIVQGALMMVSPALSFIFFVGSLVIVRIVLNEQYKEEVSTFEKGHPTEGRNPYESPKERIKRIKREKK